MSSTLQIIGPAAIDLIEGTTLASLDLLPPGGLAVSDTNAAASISVTLGSSLSLSASSAGGATVIDSGGALTLSGGLAAVNAALASLILTGTAAGAATLAMTASDGTASASTVVGLETLPDRAPAFVAPAASLALVAGVGASVGLTLADDPAVALGLLGAAPEGLSVTLLASSGVLLLDPGVAPGIGIAGDATGALTLSATSTEFASLDAALAAVRLDAGSGGSLRYIASQTSGPLALTDTSGSLSYTTTGTIGATAESWAGQSIGWQTAAAWSGDATPGLGTDVTIGGTATVLGFGVAASLSVAQGAVVDVEAQIGLAAATLASGSTLVLGVAAVSVAGSLVLDAATIAIGAAGSLAAGAVSVGSAGALIDFGTAVLGGMAVDGAALLPGGVLLDGPIGMGSGGLIDFAGSLQADSAAPSVGLTAISLAAGATIAGAGTLIAGNFSFSDNIAGPGTIVASGPTAFEVLAGSVGGGVHFVIDPGASLEFGAVAPLYGVFNATPVTVGGDATISFAPGASAGQDATGYASTLGEQGGVLVIDNPESFSGTILGFLAGERIVLSTLSPASVFNVTTNSFEVEGSVIGNATQSVIVTLHASLAAGLTPVIETDAAGNAVIGLRAASAVLDLNDTAASLAVIDAVNGVATPIEGLGVLVPSDGSAGLVLTITASHGLIGDGGTTGSALTLSATSALALNTDMAALNYTAPGSGTGDVLNFSGSAGLAGLSAAIAIDIGAAATLGFAGASGALFDSGSAWNSGAAPAVGDVAAFSSHQGAPLLVGGVGAASELSIGGAYDFAGALDLAGSAGVALEISGGGFALFDADAVVTLGASAVIGDVGGAGTLGIAGTVYAPSDTIVVGGVAGAAGSVLDITGNLLLAQALDLGGGAAATLDVTGNAGFAATTLGGAGALDSGLIRAGGAATLALGALDIVAGTLALDGGATVSAAAVTLGSGLVSLAGQSELVANFGLDINGGSLAVGAAAVANLSPGTLVIGASGVLDLAGSLSVGAIGQAGAATIAGGKAVVSGAFSLAGGAVLDMAAATLAVGSLTLASGATLSGSGAIGAAVAGVDLTTIDAGGVIEAVGGSLTLGGALVGGATIAAGAALDLVGGASGGTLSFAGGSFAGSDAMLVVNDVAAMQDAVGNFASGDVIDLIGIAPSLVSVTGGLVHVGTQTEFALTAASGAPAAAVAADGHGGSYISAGGAMPCFVRGSRILTGTGYRPVETLRPGDLVVTRDGGAQAIGWIGWRTIDLARDPAAAVLRPVVIAPGAFGPGRPRRALALSPLHAIFLHGVLVPAVLLVNGATITRDERGFAVTYYHVELDRHAVVLAEGLEAETYRDNGNRDRFLAQCGTPGVPVDACAPLVVGGASLREVRADLHRRAGALGYRVVHGAVAAARIDGVAAPVGARRHGGRLMFDLPVAARHLALDCRSGMAAETDPASEDRRRLGICAGVLRADGRRVAVWHGGGWHALAPGDRGLWSTGRAMVHLPRPARRISIDLLGSVPRWERDPAFLEGGFAGKERASFL